MIERTRDKFIFAKVCPVFSPRLSYYRNVNRITMLAHGVLQSCEQICRLPSGTRLPSILLERIGMSVRDDLSLVGFSRCRSVVSKIPIILGSIKTSRRQTTKELAAIRCAKYHAISWRVTCRSFFPPVSLGEYYCLVEVQCDDKQWKLRA